MRTLYALLASTFLWVPSHGTITYLASQLGCVTNLMVDQQTIIILDQDIIITSSCPFIFSPQPSFNNDPFIIFNAPTTTHAVIIAPSTTWNLSQLTNNHTVQFTNNAQLICHAGSLLQLNGATLRFSNNSNFIVEP